MRRTSNQYIVMRGLTGAKKSMKDINKFFKEKGWGKLQYTTELSTIKGRGGSGGRTDVIFKWQGSQQELGKLAVQRFAMPQLGISWVEDYIANERQIIPPAKLKLIKQYKHW